MTRPVDPHKYNDVWHSILIAAEADQSEIRLSGKKPAEMRLIFYSFRAAWEKHALKLSLIGKTDEAKACYANYRMLCKYRAVLTQTRLLLIHQGVEDIKMETSMEVVESSVDRLSGTGIREGTGKNGPITTGKQANIPVASFFDLPEEQKRQAERKQMEHMIRAGFGTEHEAQYFTQSEWEEWTQKPAPQHLLQLFGTAPLGKPNDEGVQKARAEKVSQAEYQRMMVGHLLPQAEDDPSKA